MKDKMKKKEVSIIVGGSKGLGRAIYLNFKKKNRKVLVISRSKKNLKDHVFLDLNDKELFNKSINLKIKKNFKIKNVIFCQRYRGDDVIGHFEVGLFSATRLINALKNQFISNSSIVFINSIASKFIGSEQGLGYHLSKAALENLVKYYSVKFGRKNVRFNSISPGVIIKPESKEFFKKSKKYKIMAREIIPLKRLCKTDDVVNLCNFLCSEKSSYITGQNIFLDGGLSVLDQETVARKSIK